MARQSTTPVQFDRTRRSDESVLMTSARAGKVVPIAYIPLLRGDSAAGRVGVDFDMAEMPKPLLNAVQANVQAWFVPKSHHPQFTGMDEFRHAYQGGDIKALGQADRQPPSLYDTVTDAPTIATVAQSEFFETLGLHIPEGTEIQTDLIDAFWLVYNFRLAAHSSRLDRAKYAQEDINEATTLPRAFWPSGRFSRIVPDYERALIVGALDLDVLSGQVPLDGIAPLTDYFTSNTETHINRKNDDKVSNPDGTSAPYNKNYQGMMRSELGDQPGADLAGLMGEMTGQSIGVTLADIDKARLTQSFAKLRTAYAGNDATGFDNDDQIVADLMQGFNVRGDDFNRPMLLDNKRVTFGMIERHATDAANLDASVSVGRASATLSLNVPVSDTGGTIIVTCEVLPERVDERMADEWLHITDVNQLPDALRDVQRPEPVDMVQNRRLDARHTDPSALYGWEGMNDVWNRSTTRLGGEYYQEDPSNPFKEQRSAIWQTSIVDPTFTADHWLCPPDFPHDVFSDTQADAFDIVCRHSVAITGLTQIGDTLAESNDDYEAVKDRQQE